jgi:ribosomal protein S18 acetylase RimI-like enzyme
MTPELPEGYVIRPAQREDAEAVVALLRANALHVAGEAEGSLDVLLEEWGDPDLDLARDTRVVFGPDGRLVAYAILWSIGRAARPTAEIFLHVNEWARDDFTEPALLQWAEARARENLPELPPQTRMVLQLFSDARETRFDGVLSQHGFAPVRHSFQMRRVFDPPPEAPQWPEGFRLHRSAPDDDPVPVLDAFRDAWRDHFGYIERPYDEALEAWRHHWAQSFKSGAWLLAMDDAVVAGLCLCQQDYYGDESCGFVDLLAVRRAYRRRGVAEALLRQAFVDLHSAGKTSVRLGVDGASLTGATRLYERAGMHVHARYLRYEKELRPGIDPSTRVAGA